MNKPTLAIYGCGGAGSNVIQNVINIPNKEGFIDVERSIFDTSDSNITLDLKKESIGHTFVQGVTGMGQNRRLAHDAVRNHIDAHLNANKPGTFNIVVFGLSGGTGSIAGPLIAGELLKRGLPTVCFIIASTEGGRETTNTINTLKTLQNLSKVHNAPLIVSYYENASELTPNDILHRVIGTKAKINTKIAADIQYLSLMCSEQHIGLDREDVKNWAFYNTQTTVKPSLCELVIVNDDDDNVLDALESCSISTASLLRDQDDCVPDLCQPYAIKGHYRSNTLSDEMHNVHFVTTSKFISKTVANLNSTEIMYREAEAAMADSSIEGLDSDMVGDDAFVL